MPTYNPNDVVVVQRNEISSSFVERVLASQPNSYLLFDSSSRLSIVPTQSLFAPGTLLDITSSFAISASWAPTVPSDVSVSSSWASSSLSASVAQSASWAPSSQQQNISVNSITASYISASGEAIVPAPVNANDAAPKYYVDNINPQGLQAYFRGNLDDAIPQYYEMHDLGTPLSASADTITTSSVTTGQYIFNFVSFGVGVTNINAGNFNVHFHAWFTGTGNAALSVVPEFWLRSGSTEIFVADEAPIALDTTVNKEYTGQITLTSSIVTNPTDRAIVKFKAFSQNQNPNAFMRVDGQTSAGITIPVPSSNFVLKPGDTMTGDLTAPGFTGSFFGSASYAPTITVGLTTTRSWGDSITSTTQSMYISNGLVVSWSVAP